MENFRNGISCDSGKGGIFVWQRKLGILHKAVHETLAADCVESAKIAVTGIRCLPAGEA